MEYTVQQFAKLAGVSARTLRHYDAIGLLKPSKIRTNGYRIYTSADADILQQILFYRELGFALGEISKIIGDSSFSKTDALKQHRKALIERKKQLDLLIANVEQTIDNNERGINMNDSDKFEGFKQKLIDDNEAMYGAEIREKYGDDDVNASYAKFKGLSQEQLQEMQRLGDEILATLDSAFEVGDYKSPLCAKLVDMHKTWLGFTWTSYTKEAHMGLAEMYANDPRFAKYYNRGANGKAEFLRDAIDYHLADA